MARQYIKKYAVSKLVYDLSALKNNNGNNTTNLIINTNNRYYYPAEGNSSENCKLSIELNIESGDPKQAFLTLTIQFLLDLETDEFDNFDLLKRAIYPLAYDKLSDVVQSITSDFGIKPIILPELEL